MILHFRLYCRLAFSFTRKTGLLVCQPIEKEDAKE